MTWYEAAAKAGVPSAQFKLANAYFAGAGVPRDPAQALLWYGRAAQQGLPEAQHALGIMLIGGVAGTPDPVEGYKWLLLAERAGHPDTRVVREKAAEQIPERGSQARRGAGAEFVADLRTADRRRRRGARQQPRPRPPLSRPWSMPPSRARRGPTSRSRSAAAPAG